VRLTARPDSFEVTDDISQKDKLEIESKTKQEVLEIGSYPEITFESSSISAIKMGDDRYAANIKGELTLHGLTRSQTIIAQVAINGETFRASGEFSLRQTDYGIKLVSVAGGTLKVKDELKCAFDFVARKQE
jgi:polyisoprenoid-binding protein YceI